MEELARAHDPAYLAALEAFCAEGGGDIDADTYARPDSWTAARPSRRRRPGRPRRARAARRGCRLRAGPAAGPPRHRRARHGFLSRQQRRGRRRVAHGTRGAGAHRRLGRASRERHPGDLLGRPRRALRLDASAPPLSRNGASRRGRRARRSRPARSTSRCHRARPATWCGRRSTRRPARRSRSSGPTGCSSRAASTPIGPTRSATCGSRAGTSPSWPAWCASSHPGPDGSRSSSKAGTTRAALESSVVATLGALLGGRVRSSAPTDGGPGLSQLSADRSTRRRAIDRRSGRLLSRPLAVHEDRAVRVGGAVLADRADQHADELAVATAADHQQLGALGGLDEDRGRMAADQPGVQLQPRVFRQHLGDGGVERLLHVRLGIEVVGDRHRPARSSTATPMSSRSRGCSPSGRPGGPPTRGHRARRRSRR